MTSRPAPGIQESLQHRGGGSAYAPARRAVNPQHGQQDSAADAERAPVVEERASKARPKGKSIPLEAIQTTPSENVRPLPRGRPQLFYSNAAATPSGADLPSHIQPAVNLPVPPRPGSSVPGDAPQQRRILPGGTGVKSEAVVKLQGHDAPTLAIVFPGGKTADLFPWTGNHPEDVLSETLVKGGISNKSQIMNETNTARPSLWSNLKNKSGMSTLSSLFVAVLEKRQACSRLTAPNTFKPPPRLTLRDSTRETWLHDLANPTVGLRRLSRTIPHGITGKVLLEQCLNKNIPIPRAVWLAKCVGINEMRTHKRKGQAGTITWVRGWTSSVEQFLEGSIAAIGQQDWKPRITYALQLVTHLCKEHLLEDEHFLDWILKSLDSCTPERLFVWLLVVCISNFWHDLVSSRRRGKRLAESLLNHAEKFYELDGHVPGTPILAFLENVLLKLIITKPACLLLPASWPRYEPVLRLLKERRPQPEIARAIDDLNARNKNLMRPSNSAGPLVHDVVGQIYRLLDAVDYSVKVRIDDLSYRCMEITPDIISLVSTVLSWASSLYRQGCHRIYLVTRLLRKWDHMGADVYDAILSYLPSLAVDQSKEPAVVFRIIAELVRSRTFSPGRFLQWLIATGSLSHHQDLHSPSAWPLRLITEIPLTGLSEHVQTLRCTLLRGTIYSTDEEEQAIISLENEICQQLPGMFNVENVADHSMYGIELPSPTVRLEVSAWLRGEVAASMEFMERIPTKDPSVDISGTVCNISPSDFHVIRCYLEKFEDMSILADIVGVVSTSLDSNVLSALADTLSYNLEAFRAIGAFEQLFEKVAMRYAAIRTVQFPERDLLLSLTDLARTAHADPQLMQILSYDLSRYDQRNSLAACSPASDSMADGMATLDLEEEIERILSSGNSMDQQMMSRVFEKIATNLKDQVDKGTSNVENVSTWLYRLRAFEENTFDTIVASWIQSLLLNHQVQLLSVALPCLVASGCLTLPYFLKTLQQCIKSRQSSHPGDSLRIAAEGLDKLLPIEPSRNPIRQYDTYRYRLAQHKFCKQREGGILDFVGELIALGSAGADKQFLDICASDRLLSVLRQFAIADVQRVSALMAPCYQGLAQLQLRPLESMLRRLLDPLGRMNLQDMSLEQQTAAVASCVDQLSLPFCQLVLQHIFSASASSTENVESVSAAFLSTIKAAIEKEQPCWSELISGLEPGLMNKIRDHAERQVIDTTAFLCSSNTSETSETMSDKKMSIRRYMSVINATAAGTASEVQGSLIVSLVDRLKGVTEAFSSAQNMANNAETNGMASDLRYWLNVLLRLTVVHGPSLMAKANNQHQAALLWALRNLLCHPSVEAYPATALSVFDVTTLLSDRISDDVRKHLAKLDMARTPGNGRCAFIFGVPPSPDAWLSLAKPILSPSQPIAASSPQTQQPPNAPSPALMQRTSSQQSFQQQMQAQSQARGGYQYPPHQSGHKMLPQQLQRMGSNGHGGQTTQQMQLQQMQQMQALVQQQQRNMQSSMSQQQQQRTAPGAGPQQAGGAKGFMPKQEKVEMKHFPFMLNRWEVLPDSGGNPAGNETAISLSLFGARRA